MAGTGGSCPHTSNNCNADEIPLHGQSDGFCPHIGTIPHSSIACDVHVPHPGQDAQRRCNEVSGNVRGRSLALDGSMHAAACTDELRGTSRVWVVEQAEGAPLMVPVALAACAAPQAAQQQMLLDTLDTALVHAVHELVQCIA